MYRDIWLIMLLVGTLLLIITVVLFFAWGIPSLLDEVSGRKAKKQVKLLHDMNISSGTIDMLSTDDIYASVSSGILPSDKVDKGSGNIEIKDADEEDESTTFLGIENESKPSVSDNRGFSKGIQSILMAYMNDIEPDIRIIEEKVSDDFSKDF